MKFYILIMFKKS